MVTKIDPNTIKGGISPDCNLDAVNNGICTADQIDTSLNDNHSTIITKMFIWTITIGYFLVIVGIALLSATPFNNQISKKYLLDLLIPLCIVLFLLYGLYYYLGNLYFPILYLVIFVIFGTAMVVTMLSKEMKGQTENLIRFKLIILKLSNKVIKERDLKDEHDIKTKTSTKSINYYFVLLTFSLWMMISRAILLDIDTYKLAKNNFSNTFILGFFVRSLGIVIILSKNNFPHIPKYLLLDFSFENLVGITINLLYYAWIILVYQKILQFTGSDNKEEVFENVPTVLHFSNKFYFKGKGLTRLWQKLNDGNGLINPKIIFFEMSIITFYLVSLYLILYDATYSTKYSNFYNNFKDFIVFLLLFLYSLFMLVKTALHKK